MFPFPRFSPAVALASVWCRWYFNKTFRTAREGEPGVTTELRAGPGMEPNWEVLTNHWCVLLAYGWKEAITEQKKHGWSEPIFVNQIFIKGIFPPHTFFFAPSLLEFPWLATVCSFLFFFWIPSFVKFQTKDSVNQFYTTNICKPKTCSYFKDKKGAMLFSNMMAVISDDL